MSNVHQVKNWGKDRFMVSRMIRHSGKWDEIGQRADNEVMGARIQRASAKDPKKRCWDVVSVHFKIARVLSKIKSGCNKIFIS